MPETDFMPILFIFRIGTLFVGLIILTSKCSITLTLASYINGSVKTKNPDAVFGTGIDRERKDYSALVLAKRSSPRFKVVSKLSSLERTLKKSCLAVKPAPYSLETTCRITFSPPEEK